MKKKTKPADEKKTETKTKKQENSEVPDRIREQIHSKLGTIERHYRTDVKIIWKHTYRVNVWTEVPGVVSQYRIANSFFVKSNESGKIVSINPQVGV